jgi:hypothetical protein
MRRDMDLVREILLTAEGLPAEGGYIDPLPGHPDELVRYHLRIMQQAGLLDAQFTVHEGTAHEAMWLDGLTWAGHEFLDAARDNTRWKAAIRKVRGEAGGIAFEVLRDYLLSEGKRMVGLSP